MDLKLIPQPKRLEPDAGFYRLPARRAIGISGSELAGAARHAADLLGSAAVFAAAPGADDTLTLVLDGALPARAHTLTVGERGIRIAGASPEAVFNGLQTLRQILAQSPAGRLPRLRIEDAPDFPDRGVYYDVCRGRVPKLERLLELADQLARYKINQLQLYIEHTFAFRRHPKIGTDASPLSPDDILRLDAFCRERHIELLPSLASFGHLATVLKHPEYHHLAEDWSEGRYLDPEAGKIPAWQRTRGWTLSPANPDIYPFLDSLFAEFLPLFSSTRFNICCDETWDLGLGQSYELCKTLGKGKVYLGHIVKVRDLCEKYGKKALFWGDIIRHYPELIADIPKDVTVLDWGYGARHPFDRIRDFREAGLPFYACPGTSSWVSLFPRLHEARANIAGFARAGREHGALGLLNTDWGDGGHYNFMEYSWHGFLFGADQAWNVGADQAGFTARFVRLLLESNARPLAAAVDRLGEISHLGVAGYYQSVWQHLFFAAPGDPVLRHEEPLDASVCEKGVISDRRIRLDAALGRAALKHIAPVRRVLAAHAGARGEDPLRILPYWVFAADTIAHAARKLALLGPGGPARPADRTALRRELTALRRRFQTLWNARNRPSEIRVTLDRYHRAIESLKA